MSYVDPKIIKKLYSSKKARAIFLNYIGEPNYNFGNEIPELFEEAMWDAIAGDVECKIIQTNEFTDPATKTPYFLFIIEFCNVYIVRFSDSGDGWEFCTDIDGAKAEADQRFAEAMDYINQYDDYSP